MSHSLSVFTIKTLRLILAGTALATLLVLALATGTAMTAAADPEQPKQKPPKPELPPGFQPLDPQQVEQFRKEMEKISGQ